MDTSNELWNLDEFVGDINEPKKQIDIVGVKIVAQRLGDFSTELLDDYFDIAFSVSVIDPVPVPQGVINFFKDGARVLKRNGRMLHAIDLHLWDDPNKISQQRLDIYLAAVEESGLTYENLHRSTVTHISNAILLAILI